MIGIPEELTVVIQCIMIISPLEKEPLQKGLTGPNHPTHLGTSKR